MCNCGFYLTFFLSQFLLLQFKFYKKSARNLDPNKKQNTVIRLRFVCLSARSVYMGFCFSSLVSRSVSVGLGQDSSKFPFSSLFLQSKYIFIFMYVCVVSWIVGLAGEVPIVVIVAVVALLNLYSHHHCRMDRLD